MRATLMLLVMVAGSVPALTLDPLTFDLPPGQARSGWYIFLRVCPYLFHMFQHLSRNTGVSCGFEATLQT